MPVLNRIVFALAPGASGVHAQVVEGLEGDADLLKSLAMTSERIRSDNPDVPVEILREDASAIVALFPEIRLICERRDFNREETIDASSTAWHRMRVETRKP